LYFPWGKAKVPRKKYVLNHFAITTISCFFYIVLQPVSGKV
jgi:hypothetical protein